MSRDRLPQWFLDSDPARDAHRPANPNDAALQAILRTPATRPAPPAKDIQTARHPYLRRGVWGLTGVAAATGAFAIGTSLLTPTAAFADWTPEPSPAPADFAEQATQACELSVTEIQDPAGDPQIVQHEAELVALDLRGSHAYLLGATENGWSECFVSLNRDGESLTVVGNGGHNPTPLPTPDSNDITVLGNATTSWSADGDEPAGSITSAYGKTGSEVTGITLTTTTGQTVEATVENGWWAAWIPATEAFTETAEVATVAGNKSTHDLSIAG